MNDELTIEEIIKRLKEIEIGLRNENTEIAEGLKFYEEAKKLYKIAEEKLNSIEKIIESDEEQTTKEN